MSLTNNMHLMYTCTQQPDFMVYAYNMYVHTCTVHCRSPKNIWKSDCKDMDQALVQTLGKKRYLFSEFLINQLFLNVLDFSQIRPYIYVQTFICT